MKKVILVGVTMLSMTIDVYAQQWGITRYVCERTTIRARRSKTSIIVGVLRKGQKVKVDLLKNNWYAVFNLFEKVRSESRAIGYVYAPATSPDPNCKKRALKSVRGLLRYRVAEREDVSYGNASRMVYRVVVNVRRIPKKIQLNKLALYLWKDGNRKWDEFTIFIYLPGMNLKSMAYAVAEFRPDGLKELKVQEVALMVNKWRGK